MLRLSPLFAFLLIVGCSSVGGPGLDDQELPGNNNRPDGVTPKDDTVKPDTADDRDDGQTDVDDTDVTTDDGVCVPDCDGKECGDNGCNGTCGNCGAGEACEDGICQCIPEFARDCCGDAICWFDGCGNQGEMIKECEKGCKNGACSDCKPNCVNKKCGDDGCGGSCGTCTAPYCEDDGWVGPGRCVDGTCYDGVKQHCQDGLECTETSCDDAEGCKATLLDDWCLIAGQCVADGAAGGLCVKCDAQAPLAWTCAAADSCDDGDDGTTDDTCAGESLETCTCAARPVDPNPCGMDLNPTCDQRDCTTDDDKEGRCVMGEDSCICEAKPEIQCTDAIDCLGREWLVDCVGHWSCTKSRQCQEVCNYETCGDGTCDPVGGEDHHTCPRDCYLDPCVSQEAPKCEPVGCKLPGNHDSECGKDPDGNCICLPLYGFCEEPEDCLKQRWPIRCHGSWECLKGVCDAGCPKTCGDKVCDPGEDVHTCPEDCTRSKECDDGTELKCNMTLPPECEGSDILAIQDECWICVDPRTCKPGDGAACFGDRDCEPTEWCDPCGQSDSCPSCGVCEPTCTKHGCETELEAICDRARPDCGESKTSVIRDGCWVCVNLKTCD